MIPARIIHLDAKGLTHAPPHRAVSFHEATPSSFFTVPFARRAVGCDAWRLDLAVNRVLNGQSIDAWRLDLAVNRVLNGQSIYVDVWLVNGQRVRVRPSAKWIEARKEMFK